MLGGLLNIARGVWGWIQTRICRALDFLTALLTRLRQRLNPERQHSDGDAATAPIAPSFREPTEAKPALQSAPEIQPQPTRQSREPTGLGIASRLPSLLSRRPGRADQPLGAGSAASPSAESSGNKRAQAPADPLEAPTDETALARMLASEPRFQSARELIGWLTIQRARARSLSVYQLLTQGKGYGPQDRGERGGGSMFASTARRPSAADVQLARALLSGEVQPAEAIRQRIPGRWIERGQSLSDAEILARQVRWGEGIYARVQGTCWLLLSSSVSPLQTTTTHSASDILNLVPEVPAFGLELPATT